MAAEFIPWHSEAPDFAQRRTYWSRVLTLTQWGWIVLIITVVLLLKPSRFWGPLDALLICLAGPMLERLFMVPLKRYAWKRKLEPQAGELKCQLTIRYQDKENVSATLISEEGAALYDEDEILFRSGRCEARILRRDFVLETWSLEGNRLQLTLLEDPRITYSLVIDMPEKEATEQARPFRFSHKDGGRLPDPTTGIRETSEVWLALAVYGFFAVPFALILLVFAVKGAMSELAAGITALVVGFFVALYIGSRMRRRRLAWLDNAVAEILAARN